MKRSQRLRPFLFRGVSLLILIACVPMERNRSDEDRAGREDAAGTLERQRAFLKEHDSVWWRYSVGALPRDERRWQRSCSKWNVEWIAKGRDGEQLRLSAHSGYAKGEVLVNFGTDERSSFGYFDGCWIVAICHGRAVGARVVLTESVLERGSLRVYSSKQECENDKSLQPAFPCSPPVQGDVGTSEPLTLPPGRAPVECRQPRKASDQKAPKLPPTRGRPDPKASTDDEV